MASPPPLKAILVAGGLGTRLLPFTRYTHKTLLPLHRHPVLDYALAFIRRAGISDITIIANQFIGQIAKHVGTGLDGENIHYVIEDIPKGVGNALQLARPHTIDCRLLIFFSDNITTADFGDDAVRFANSVESPGCVLLGRKVPDPTRFGVAVMDENEGLSGIVEKPSAPPTNIAIGGIYLYDENFWDMLDKFMLQCGDEFTISDINNQYIADGKAVLRHIDDSEWLDCGTPDALLEAAQLAAKGILSPEPYHHRSVNS